MIFDQLNKLVKVDVDSFRSGVGDIDHRGGRFRIVLRRRCCEDALRENASAKVDALSRPRAFSLGTPRTAFGGVVRRTTLVTATLLVFAKAFVSSAFETFAKAFSRAAMFAKALAFAIATFAKTTFAKLAKGFAFAFTLALAPFAFALAFSPVCGKSRKVIVAGAEVGAITIAARPIPVVRLT